VAAAVLAGCAGGGGEPADPGDEALVRGYVAAMAAGDVEAAMGFRCEAAQVPADLQAQFADESQRLFEVSGPIEVDHVRAADEEIEAPDATEPRTVVVGLRSGDQAVSELEELVVTEAGRRVLCGRRVPRAVDRMQTAVDRLEDHGDAPASIADLLPDWEGPGFEPLDAGATPAPDTATGELEVAARSWSRGELGRATVLVVRFDSPEHAREGAERYATEQRADVVEEFVPVGLADVAGVRYLGFGRTLVQPPEVGPFTDRVVELLGDVVVVSTVTTLGPSDNHALVSDLAGSVDDLARP
jgi:hypothetical protein